MAGSQRLADLSRSIGAEISAVAKLGTARPAPLKAGARATWLQNANTALDEAVLAALRVEPPVLSDELLSCTTRLRSTWRDPAKWKAKE